MSPQTWYRASRCNYTFLAFIKGDGVFERGPYGWTVTRSALGVYLITHNLGHLNYVPIVVVLAPADAKSDAGVTAMTANTVTVTTFDTAGGQDLRFALVVHMAEQ